MAGPFDFKGQKIQDTYGRVVQIATGSLYDGKGTLINANIQAIADASDQRQSESIELSAISSSVVELQHFSSSLDANFATDAELSALSSSILVTTNNLADDIDENEEELDNQGARIATLTAATSSYVTFPYTGSAIITGSLILTGSIFAETTAGSQTLVIKSADASINNNASVYIGNTTNPTVRNVAIGYINSPRYDSVQIGGRNVGGGIGGVAIGDSAASNNSTYSTIAIGGSANRFSNGDIGIGQSALYNDGNVYGSAGTIAIGHNSGNGQDGTQNVILGSQAARNSLGINSIFVGYHSGRYNIGSNSVILGHSAGYNVTGSNNVLLGYQAGYNLTGSNQLIIANNSSSALITGDFENNTLDISGSSTIIGSGNNPLNTIFSVKNPFSSQTNLFNIGEKGDIAFQGGPFSNRFISSIYPEMRLWGGQGTIGFDGGSFLLRAGKRFAIQHHPGYTEGIRFGTFGGSYYAGFYNQKLGIGTSSPSEKLTVNGNISASGNFITDSHITASGSVSASTYYGDGSNLTGISTTPFPYIGSAVITGSLTVSGSVVDFTSASTVNLNIDSLPLINPIVEYLDVTSSIASGTTLTLPNNLSYISSSTYEYIEIFMNGLRIRYDRDFVPMSNTTIQTQITFPSGSELTFKSLKR